MNLPPAPVVSPLPENTRIRLDIAYDGTDFSGWAIQPELRTVQGQIEAGLAAILQSYPP